MNTGSSIWDDPKNVEKLRKLWADGYSASEIAARMGDITRNTVIGKVARLRLPPRDVKIRKRPKWQGAPHPWIAGTGAAPARRAQARAARAEKRKPTPAPLPLPTEDVAPRSIIEPTDERYLETRHCRAIYGDPKSPEHGYCPADPVPGLSYCAHHQQRFFEPGSRMAGARARATPDRYPTGRRTLFDSCRSAAVD